MTTMLTSESLGVSRAISRSRIRPLHENDLGQINDLYHRVTGHAVNGNGALLRRILFEAPWRDGGVSSIVCEDNCGRIVASLAIMPRPMMFRGRSILAAVGHHFLAESSRPGTRAGIALARKFMEGPQDLALSAGNEFSRRIWTFLGGSVSPLHSFAWTRTLRPKLNLFGWRFSIKRPQTLSDDLDAVTMHACISAFASERALHPVYDISSVAWLVDTLNESHDRGALHKVAVRTRSGQPLGWYLYYLERSGNAEVLQIGGREETFRDVLQHLFFHARERGAVAVSGPMDARLFGVLSENHCVFHRPVDSWTLIHARDERIADAFHSGDAFVSRLEGAWWGLT